MKIIRAGCIIVCLLIPGLGYLGSQSVVNTVHNLSVAGPGSIRAVSEQEVCIFCHTPHNSKAFSPLWNRNDPGTTYILYNSSTLQAIPGQPDGTSILCLSCHDGTIALGSVLSLSGSISMVSGITTMPAGIANLSTDLSDDHPISFLYSAALAAADGELVNPAVLPGPVRLENGKVQCISCHDPHTNLFTDFLVISSENSSLCMACHQKNLWTTSTHRTSTAIWSGSGIDPWPHTSYSTVSQNGCENCHNPHTAVGKPRLLNSLIEENNCLNCHNGNVATTNIQVQLTKAYVHDVVAYLGVHDPVETTLASTYHVECVDCHNPHASNAGTANAPLANGFIAGVKGIDQNGNAVTQISFEYELCYRCHTSSPGMASPAVSRQIVQNNVRLEFATTNPSFHPVVGPRNKTDVPSLIFPWTSSSVMYCTDCHASDGSSSPDGPHGSIYPHILKLQYQMGSNVQESAAAYALCYSCHSRTSILNDVSFERHHLHIVDEHTPCITCHDAHGISSMQGNSLNNSNLINFRLGSGGPTPWNNLLKYEDLGTYHGQCYMRCHGEDHDPFTY